MKYGIQPLGELKAAYIWRYPTFEAAKAAALEMTERHKMDFLVFKVIGTYSNTVRWDLAE